MSTVISNTEPPPALETRSRRPGCIAGLVGGGCLLVVLFCGGSVALLVTSVFGMIKNSEPYAKSLERATQNPAVQTALGEPIEPAFLITGNIHLNNDDGDADLTYDISGPEGSGTVRVVGTKTDGVWNYGRMNVTLESGDTIDLLE